MTDWYLIRGLSREAGHWGAFPRLFESAFNVNVHCLDLPGFGIYHREVSPTDIAGIVGQIRRTVVHSVKPLNLFAISLGGMVGALWAHNYPHEISKLILINSSMRPYCHLFQRLRPGCYRALVSAMVARDLSERESSVLNLSSNHQRGNRRIINEWVSIQQERPITMMNFVRQMRAAASFSYPNGSSKVKTLVLSSSQDRLVNPVCSQRIADAWGVTHGIHPTAGHDIPLDDPNWTLDKVGNWIE